MATNDRHDPRTSATGAGIVGSSGDFPVWYLRAKLDSGKITEGSATLVWVRPHGESKAEPRLVTARHVVQNEDAYGAWFCKTIEAWSPGEGYSENSFELELDVDLTPDADKSLTATPDIAFLRFVIEPCSAPARLLQDSMCRAGQTGFSVVGYNGGEASIKVHKHIVHPLLHEGCTIDDIVEASGEGILRTGTSPLSGASGGGVFWINAGGNFLYAGIYCGVHVEVGQYSFVPISALRRWSSRQGYELVECYSIDVRTKVSGSINLTGPGSELWQMLQGHRPAVIAALESLTLLQTKEGRLQLIQSLSFLALQPAADAPGFAQLVFDSCAQRPCGLDELMEALDTLTLPMAEMAGLYLALDHTVQATCVSYTELRDLRVLIGTAILVPDDIAIARFRSLFSSLNAPGELRSNRKFTGCLTSLAREHACQGEVGPVFAYLEGCRAFFATHGQCHRIDQWEQRVALRLQLNLTAVRAHVPRLAGPAAQERTDPVLQVLVNPETAGQDMKTQATLYRFAAWLHTGTGETFPVQLEASAPLAAQDLPVNFAAVVDAGSLQAGGQSLRVELFLPYELLETPFENAEIPLGFVETIPVGFEFPFVVRSHDRIFHPRFVRARNKWVNKWESVKPDEAVNDIRWAHTSTVYSPDFLQKLEDASALALIAFTLTHAPEEGKPVQVLNRLLTAGLPFALWLREHKHEHPHDQSETALTSQVFSSPPAEWPARILALRRQWFNSGKHCPICTGVTLLWDDASRLPPDPQNRFSAPAQRST